MNITLRCCLLVFALCCSLPQSTSAGLFGKGFRNCCQRCELPENQCGCQQPVFQPTAVPQTTYQPVIQTQYVQQPAVTYRDVVETQYRSEPVTQTVPVTTYDNVAVDEGSYQSVWVPKMVTKQVPRTSYQTQTTYRNVPYQISRRVPEYTTQTVPTQTTRYVPTTTMVQSCPTGCLPATAALTYPQTPIQNTYTVPPVPPATAIVPPPYTTTAVPTYPTPVPTYATSFGSALSPVPDPRFATNDGLTPITPRTASRFDTYKNRHVVSESEIPPARTASRDLQFVPAPSAAAVFRTPRGTYVR